MSDKKGERDFIPSSSKMVDVTPPQEQTGEGRPELPAKTAKSLNANTNFHDQATAMYGSVDGLSQKEKGKMAKPGESLNLKT